MWPSSVSGPGWQGEQSAGALWFALEWMFTSVGGSIVLTYKPMIHTQVSEQMKMFMVITNNYFHHSLWLFCLLPENTVLSSHCISLFAFLISSLVYNCKFQHNMDCNFDIYEEVFFSWIMANICFKNMVLASQHRMCRRNTGSNIVPLL